MGIFETLGNFKSGFAGFATYAWILWIFVPLAIIIFAGYMWKIIREKNKQWTHNLIVERVLTNGQMSKQIITRMKRFPLVKNASVFQLEKPFLGSYLMPELDSYTGTNEFSVILDRNNRIYIKTGSRFEAESSSVIVSAKHAGIDLSFEDLKSDWQHQYKENQIVEWSKIAKFALFGLLIIASMVVGIKAIGQWGENHQVDAKKATAEAEAMRNLADAMETTQATMNAQILVLDLLKKGYGTNNIQAVIQEKTNGNV